MQLDQKMLNRLLAMNDEQLGALIGQIATEAGIDPAELGLQPQNIAAIRQALGNATDADLEKLNRVYEEYRQNRRKK